MTWTIAWMTGTDESLNALKVTEYDQCLLCAQGSGRLGVGFELLHMSRGT